MKINKYLEMWTLPMFFLFPYLSLLPIPVMISAQTKGFFYFFLWSCLCCLVISASPEDLSRTPGHSEWIQEGDPVCTPNPPKFAPFALSHLGFSSANLPGLLEKKIWIWSGVEKTTEGETRKTMGKAIRKFGIASSLDPWDCGRVLEHRGTKRDGFFSSQVKLGK